MIHDLRSLRTIGKRDFVLETLHAMQVQPQRHPQGDELAPVKVEARVDWGRWLVDCPFCPGAALVDWDEPLHFCLSCHNAAGGHRWVEVVLPTQEERNAIEAALEDLPESAQHWRPGQTIEDLAAGRPFQGPQMHPDQAMALAQSAGEERNRLSQRVEALQTAHAEERRGALALIRVIERMQLEASIRKQLNRDLQDQLDAFEAHEHDN